MKSDMEWEELKGLTEKAREISFEFGTKRVTVKVRNLTVNQREKLMEGLMSDMPDEDPSSKKFLREYVYRNITERVSEVAGHQMEKGEWESMDSDLMDTLMWMLTPVQMTLLASEDGLVKKLQEG